MFSPLTSGIFEIPKDWIYRGEGNCNVVVSLLKERKILRIRKIKKSVSLLSWLINWITDILYWYCGNPSDDELRDLTFYKKIIRPLIGGNFVCDAKQVFLSKKQINILEENLNSQRPDFRKNKCLQYGRAALFDDYAFLPDEYYPFDLSNDTFSIEIKPKQGWIPFSEKHFPKCIFCMKQFYKRNKGHTRTLSSYCPLDLFSGESIKMVKAVKALINNPQNNLKIFKNGEYCYGENHRMHNFPEIIQNIFDGTTCNYEDLYEEFCVLIQKSLLTNFESIQRTNYCDRKLFCEWNKIIQENSLQTRLPKGSVLERILSVQMLDVEGNQYYYKLSGNNKSFNEYDYVTKLLKEVSKNEKTCLKCLIMMLGSGLDKKELHHSDLKLAPYLISAIAKDCSIMLTFKKILEPSSDNFGMKNVIRTKHGDFIVNVGVFDLYPKPVSTIFKNQKKIRKMLELCSEENDL